jgi:protein-S-isoprenylcysteine O-methyltransferase Ste14
MYFGAVFFFIGATLLLGSWWGLVFVPVFTDFFCARIPIEERALRASLEGYDEYTARVPYRLVPRVRNRRPTREKAANPLCVDCVEKVCGSAG